jgi:hypothetical protein
MPAVLDESLRGGRVQGMRAPSRQCTTLSSTSNPLPPVLSARPASILPKHFLSGVGVKSGVKSAESTYVAGGRELPAGCWCCDGDNFASGDVLQFYDEAALAAAAVAVLLALVKYAKAFGDPPLDGAENAVSEPGQDDLVGDGASS